MKKIFSMLAALLLTGMITQAFAVPPGYSMSNAISAGVYNSSGSYSDTQNSATGGFTNNYGNAAKDVWYSFTLSSTATSVMLSLCGSSFDTYLHVLNSSGTEIGSNDDNGPACTGAQSSLNLTSLAPGTYYVVAEGYSRNTGTINFSLNVSIVPPITISYSGPQIYAAGAPISPLSPSVTGGLPYPGGQTSTFAGMGTQGYRDGTAQSAMFGLPLAVAADAGDNIYVADANNHAIRKITPAGVVSTLAGSGYTGSTNGTGAAASFNHPAGLAIDAAGNVFVADQVNNLIRKITPAGVVTTFAGSGSAGSVDGTGTGASFNNPTGVCFDNTGNLLVADYSNHKIRKITPAGVVSTFAGTGSPGAINGAALSASFKNPMSMTVDTSGNVYVADRLNSLIRKITPAGVVSTFAGSGTVGSADGTGTAASFNIPTNLKADPAGNLFVTDAGNNMIRKITPAGVVSTLAGALTPGLINGAGSVARFNNPYGLCLDSRGNIYIAEANNYIVRKVITRAFTISPNLPAGLVWNDVTGVISGTPTAASPATSYTITAYNEAGSASATLTITVNDTRDNFSADQNYIVTYMPRIEGLNTSEAVISASGDKTKVMTTIQYLDGLGRPLQTVQVKGSPLGKDVVQPIAYDQFGREATKYLPYAASTTDGSYKADALNTGAGQGQFYTSPPAGVGQVNYPSASTDFEASPLNRVIEEGAPGSSWQLSNSGVTGSGHTVKMAYRTNGPTDVTLWFVNTAGNGATGGTTSYPANQLYSITTTDENGNNKIEYKDKKGHVVCKKVQSAGTTYLATYYIYNDQDNLSYVIPPLPAGTAYPSSFVETDAVFINFIYGYHYDERNRLIEKKIPGMTAWGYLVYNSANQVIATQDGNLRAENQWQFTKYDALGRVMITGLWDNSNTAITRASLQLMINGLSNPLWESRPEGSYPTNSCWPTTYLATLSVNYYDDYSFPDLPAQYDYRSSSSKMTKGLLTGTKTWVLGSSAVLYTINYYDDLGRTIRTYKQHYLGGTTGAANLADYDLVTSTYDFTNAIRTTMRQHYTSANTTSPAVTIANTYVYDHMGRKTQTFEQINGGSNVLLSQSDYNEIGQVQAKHLHSVGSAPFLQDINYAYNERGWLSKINDPTIAPTTNKLFAEQLNYNLPAYGASPQYNGNIAEQAYSAGISGNQNVKYSYDAADRLTGGISSAGFSESNISYDELGNLNSLTRGTNTPYSYTYIGNQLQTVSGLTGSTYTYDANGNMLHDGRNNSNVTYNIVNLPQTVSGSATITYIYSATGEKLRKISAGVSTDYISGIQYKGDGTIDFIQTEEGRANRSGTNYVYEYTLTDHLGNNRVMFDQTNGKVGENDYYPFGLNAPRQINAGNKYLYNKKEIQEELGQYDYGARFYDPVIGRWTSVDPLAEASRRFSPFIYGNNNPLRFIDPDGMLTELFSQDSRNREKPQKKDPFAGMLTNVNPTTFEKYEQQSKGGNDEPTQTDSETNATSIDENGDNGGSKNADQGGDPPNYRLKHIIKDGIEMDNTPFLILFPVLKGVKTIGTLLRLVKEDPAEVLQSIRNLKNFKYDSRLQNQTDLYHDFPRSFDKTIIDNAPWAQRVKDGANWFEYPGSVNSKPGNFQIGINDQGVIFHRNFVPLP